MTKVFIQTDVRMEIEVPHTPNFLKADGLKEWLSVREMTTAHLEAIAEAWTVELLKKAKDYVPK